MTAIRGTTTIVTAWSLPQPSDVTGVPFLDALLVYWIGLAIALPTVGGGDALARDANELPPPRVAGLWRSAQLTILFGLAITATSTFLFLLLVPPGDQVLWVGAPLAGLSQHLVGPAWVRDLMALAVACAAGLVLVPAAYAAVTDAERMLYRSSAEGTLSAGLRSLHTRFGTPSRVMDVAVAAVIGAISQARRATWLAHAYGIAIAAFLITAIAALVHCARLTVPRRSDTCQSTSQRRSSWWSETGLVVGSVVAMVAIGDAVQSLRSCLSRSCVVVHCVSRALRQLVTRMRATRSTCCPRPICRSITLRLARATCSSRSATRTPWRTWLQPSGPLAIEMSLS